MENCDVLILGGGPAGSTCARELRRHGLDVQVFDHQNFPRDKVCAGWVTPAVLDALQIDRAEYMTGRTLQPITGFHTGMIDGAEVETRYPQTVSYGIRRCEFDHYLLQRSGGRLRLGEPLRSLERRGLEWIVNGEIKAPMLIGAGGHFCPVARLLGAKSGGREPVVAAKEVEFAMDEQQEKTCGAQPETPELFFCRDLKGYGWCFRKGRYLNIGMGREENHRLGDHLSAFCVFLKQRGKIPADIPDKFHGHAYLLNGHGVRRKIDDGVLLIGDAAGLAYPQSGEGIRPAIESALLAAVTIVQAGQDYRRENLASYPQQLIARLGTGKRADSALPQGVHHYLGSKLLGNSWFARHVVLDRWFLHSQQGALRIA